MWARLSIVSVSVVSSISYERDMMRSLIRTKNVSGALRHTVRRVQTESSPRIRTRSLLWLYSRIAKLFWLKSLDLDFYSAPQCSHCKRCTSYSISAVCPSVCLSHAGTVSKRRHIARCSLHCQIAKCVQSFVETKQIFLRDDPFPLKSWLKLTYPLLTAASLDTFCLVAPQR